MSTVNLTMTRGDTKAMQFTVSGLPPTGLTGYTFWFTAKNDVTDADIDAVIAKVPADFTVENNGSDTVSGVVQCVLNATDTSGLPDYDTVLVYDFQIESSANVVTTAANGTLTVKPDVTRAS